MRPDPFYLTPAWLRLRAEVLADHPMCQVCDDDPSVDVDHIKRIRDGGAPLDKTNTQALCRSCHSRKTRIEQGERGERPRVRYTKPAVKGCNVDGTPRDPNHPWYS